MKFKLFFIIPAIVIFLFTKQSYAQVPILGSTADFTLFTADGAFNNVGTSTIVTGNVGTNNGAFNAFPPGTIDGLIHVADLVSGQAAIDVFAAYASFSAFTCGMPHGVLLGNGEILTPDVYCIGAAATLTGNLILDGEGDPNSIFIIKIDGALSLSSSANVVMVNSASLCNVYWQINGQLELAVNSSFSGTAVSTGAIILWDGATLDGRAVTTAGEISLRSNIVTKGTPPTGTTITAGGVTTFCEGGNVTLSGNVDGTWNTGATTPSINVTTSGDYYVTNTTNCGSVTSNHIIVTVNPLPTASILTVGQPNVHCPCNFIYIGGNVGGVWNTGATTPYIAVYLNGDYYVTNTNPCGSVESNHIIVNSNP